MKYIKVKSGVFSPFFLAYYSNEITMQMAFFDKHTPV